MNDHLYVAYLHFNFVSLQDQLSVVVGCLPGSQDLSLNLLSLIFLSNYFSPLCFQLLAHKHLIDLSEVLPEIIFDEDESDHEVVPRVVPHLVLPKQVLQPLLQKVVLDELVIRLAVVLITNTAIVYHIGRVLPGHLLRIQRCILYLDWSGSRFLCFLFFFDCLNFQNLISWNLILLLNSLFHFNTFKDNLSLS